MNQLLQEQYERLGISPEVSAFGEKIEASLKQRFEEIDARAEYNQLKVLKAMQDNRVSAECFNTTSGYGYNDPASAGRMRWCVRRSRAAPTRWRWL